MVWPELICESVIYYVCHSQRKIKIRHVNGESDTMDIRITKKDYYKYKPENKNHDNHEKSHLNEANDLEWP